LLSFEFNFSFIKNITINSQIFLVVFLIIINIFLLKKTSEIDFEYSIRKNLNLHILKKGYPLHSKIYIIDNKIAYLGSLNCTDSGFRYNHETRIKTKDKKFISDLNKLYKEFLELPAIPLKTLQKNIKTFSKKDGFDDESYTFYE
jgi:phospholipase D/transphosphatidylase